MTEEEPHGALAPQISRSASGCFYFSRRGPRSALQLLKGAHMGARPIFHEAEQKAGFLLWGLQ